MVRLSLVEKMESNWTWRIDQHHPDLEAFGRIDMHPMENLLAISWVENSSSTGMISKVSILDIDLMTEVTTWNYLTQHWTMEFSPDGTWLASSAQDGSIRLWLTEDPDPAMWSDNGVQYSHSNYTGVVAWHHEIHALMSVGWDGQAIVWDADSAQQMLNFQFTMRALEQASSMVHSLLLPVAMHHSSDGKLGIL